MRDAAEGYPLRELVGVIAEQAAVVEENIEQLYDDQFIETCSDWVAPYIGALIGYRPLHGVTAQIASPRAEVANTIGYRRRLGTASVLEQLARDVTGWPARVVEYFLLTATTQRMNHIRPQHHFAPDLRDWRGLESLGTAFDPFTRTADVRAIGRADGRYNLPNIGIHLWRLEAQPRGAAQPAPATQLDAARHLFSPLGAPLPMFTNPTVEAMITQLATPLNVPGPISRRVLHADLLTPDGLPGPADLYGPNKAGALQSLRVLLDGALLSAAEMESCNLSDEGSGWANMPAAGERIAIDPELGRIALPPDRQGEVTVSYHQGFSAEIGGGEYERAWAFAAATAERPLLRVPADHATIQDALDALPATGGIVEIGDNGRYAEALAINAGAAAAIELRAADECFPHLVLAGDLTVSGGAEAAVTVDGLLISVGAIRVPAGGGNALSRLFVRHATLVPGRTLDAAGAPAQSGQPSIIVELPGVEVEISRSILGPLQIAPEATVTMRDGIIDAAAATAYDSASGVAYSAPGGAGFGGPLTLEQVTVFGKLAAERFDLVSNSLLIARTVAGDGWAAPVHAERRQVGCMRFSFVPNGSRVPRRFRCQPQLAIDEALATREAELGGPVPNPERAAIINRQVRRIVPSFTSRRFGRPAYAQNRASAPSEILTGADDESEMGGFHLNYAPQREINLRIRLEEYLRFSLEAGSFFET
ncbi:hypothetical protein [Inquilinus ginsengisoli]|uniref:hypothetical protein n=1 Tax=Inquilinus ginsengisoli TaxID=363840 RepID=UPI003D1B2F27